jgi:hypothetical protein
LLKASCAVATALSLGSSALRGRDALAAEEGVPVVGQDEEGKVADWQAVAEFLYGEEFWYSDPFREVEGLTEEQLFWVPNPKCLCILWQAGHIAHRERTHIGRFLQGVEQDLIPSRYEAFGPDWCSVDFGPDWCSVEEMRSSIDSVGEVFAWVRDVRKESRAYIASLSDADWHQVPAGSEFGMTVAQWVFLTTVHAAMHLGRIQLLRALLEDEHDRPC